MPGDGIREGRRNSRPDHGRACPFPHSTTTVSIAWLAILAGMGLLLLLLLLDIDHYVVSTKSCAHTHGGAREKVPA